MTWYVASVVWRFVESVSLLVVREYCTWLLVVVGCHRASYRDGTPKKFLVFVHDEIYFVVNYSSSRVDVVCMCMYVYVCMCMSPSFMDFHDGITFECIEIES